MRLVALGGSLRAGSLSSAALDAALDIARRAGVDTALCDLRELDLPLYLPEAAVGAYPAATRGRIERLVAHCRDADAMLWASPAYHGTISGAFKNALDYIELLGAEPEPYLQGKAVGLISISDPSPLATMAACVTELRAWLAPTRVTLRAADFAGERGQVCAPGIRRLERLVAELQQFATMRRHASGRGH